MLDRPRQPTFNEVWRLFMSRSITRAFLFEEQIPAFSEALYRRKLEPNLSGCKVHLRESILPGWKTKSSPVETLTCMLAVDGPVALGVAFENSKHFDRYIAQVYKHAPLPCFKNVFVPGTRVAFAPYPSLQLLVRMEVGIVQSGAMSVSYGIVLCPRAHVRLPVLNYAYGRVYKPVDARRLREAARRGSADFVEAKRSLVAPRDGYFEMETIESRNQSACLFCAYRGLKICDCPVPLRRRQRQKVADCRDLQVGNAVMYRGEQTYGLFARSCTENCSQVCFVQTIRSMDMGGTRPAVLNTWTMKGELIFDTAHKMKAYVREGLSGVRQALEYPIAVEDEMCQSTDAGASSTIFADECKPTTEEQQQEGLLTTTPLSTSTEEYTTESDAGATTTTNNDNEDGGSNEHGKKQMIRRRKHTETLSSRNGMEVRRSEVGAIRKSWRCKVCSAIIRGKRGNLNRHISAKHVRMRAFECAMPKCGQRFQSKLNLERHMSRIHEGRPFECRECPRTFRRKEGLESHERAAHTKTQQYICGLCGVWFGRRLTLEKHERRLHGHVDSSHSLYECRKRECENSFVRWSDALEHERECHDGKVFECTKCDTCTRSEDELSKHVRSAHTAYSQRVRCHFCPMMFDQRGNLLQHVRVAHSNLFLDE